MGRIRVMIVDDHSVVREGLCSLVGAQPDMEIVGEAGNGRVAISLAKELRPDVILMDLSMPQMDGLEAIPIIKKSVPNVNILVLTSFADDEKVYHSVRAGALGYLLKDTPREQLIAAVRDVAEGKAFLAPALAMKMMLEMESAPPQQPLTQNPLSVREMETLQLLARGLTNQEIAGQLVLHEGTVCKYVSSILSKLQLANRTQATLYALKQGWASLDDAEIGE